MCVFLSTLPKKSKTAGTSKRKNLVLSMKPCPDENGEKTWYRFRLLNFSSKTTTRDYPFIERFTHIHWKTNDKGYPEIEDEVTCPVTKWMPWDGDRYSCPICRYANQQFIALKESGWKDADARKKNRELGRKYSAVIPVYVVNDPNYEGNNGKLKVIMFSDKKQYDEFVKKVEAQLLKANCFNGVNAVDCCMHMSLVPEIRNEGKPNQYTYNNKVVDKIVFATKQYDIPAITKEAIDAFPFDDTYYVSSTEEELQAFYKKYVKAVSNDDIPEEEEVKVYDTPVQAPVKKTNTVSETVVENPSAKSNESEDIPTNEIDDLLSDPDEKGLVEEVPVSKPAEEKADPSDDDLTDIDDLLKDI